jgi:hypothetical protein
LLDTQGSQPVTILYTANLGGALEQLPRLHTALKHLRQASGTGRTLLLDLGGSCAESVWHCASTGGRSMLIVLDAIGYTAINAVGLPEESRARLTDNFLAMALVDDTRPHPVDSILLRTAPSPINATLEIDLQPTDQIRFDGRVLRLPGLRGDQIGQLRLNLENGIPTLDSQAIHDWPTNTPPDPTITAAVEFVLAEARRLQRR